ncbi:cobalt-precorrin-6A reductase [Paracoccus sp. Z330]|uniref:Cobalt-precorrin-6A reductase n=1 Tax=Paracoccus onchidii TaxID=3017813 RepID=A0ABT4ZCQ4_9RHOB|nr:cobalt-precorrin-6A reductase [Paracoccus onchidii]MDB6177141.1 cobalt-precorrin-6A reductase [Paracoccus onchidii]
MTRILLLGGTTEASHLARLLADAGIDAIFSYAGRTHVPRTQPLQQRIGGFGGADGLAAYIGQHGISHVVDATHPFAANISLNAIRACTERATPLLALQRPPWQAEAQDKWLNVADYRGAAAALPDGGARVFLAIGRQNLDPFAEKANRYLLRLVDRPEHELPLADAHAVIARGPFSVDDDLALMARFRVTHLVAKNAGGMAARAKLLAARRLAVPVVMIERPRMPQRQIVDRAEEVLDWLHHPASARRGV